MANIFEGYPRSLRTKLLVEAIDEYADEINSSRADINKVLQFAPYISLGINELQSRQSKRVTRISFAVSILSLTVAGAALYVTYENSLASSIQERNQLEILRKLDSRLEIMQSQDSSLENAEKKHINPPYSPYERISRSPVPDFGICDHQASDFPLQRTVSVRIPMESGACHTKYALLSVLKHSEPLALHPIHTTT